MKLHAFVAMSFGINKNNQAMLGMDCVLRFDVPIKTGYEIGLDVVHDHHC
jgi:hypothetical protein